VADLCPPIRQGLQVTAVRRPITDEANDLSYLASGSVSRYRIQDNDAQGVGWSLEAEKKEFVAW